MRAVLDGDIKLDNKASLETYDQVLAILHWGRERWSNVPATDRGVVFDDTFVRGVRSMRIHEHMRVRIASSVCQLQLAEHDTGLGAG